jgi:hypothetical protein
MAGYRCYYFGRDNHIANRMDFDAESDELAIIEARAHYAESEHRRGFEVWQQEHLVYAEGRVSAT